MPKQMVSIRSPQGAPTVEEVAEKYNIAPDDIDLDFGVVQVDARDGTYTVLVESHAAKRVSENHEEVSGPYANPTIQPFDLQK